VHVHVLIWLKCSNSSEEEEGGHGGGSYPPPDTSLPRTKPWPLPVGRCPPLVVEDRCPLLSLLKMRLTFDGSI
jgi:hypothetical protein